MAVAISGLLFLAFAFFAVAQAGTTRNGAQSAADAAAVGGAKDDREQLYDGFLEAVQNDDDWGEWLDATADFSADGCGEAEYFAGRNRSDVTNCGAMERQGEPGYSVTVKTRFDTGDSVIPGAAHKKASASANAVVHPLCEYEEGSGDVEITCDDEEFTIDPDDDDPDVTPADLFSVTLVD